MKSACTVCVMKSVNNDSTNQLSGQSEDEENNRSLQDTAGYHDCILMLIWPSLPLLSYHILHPVI